MAGVFVIPKDELITYAQSSDGWSSVMYSNPSTGNNVSGWVRSSRVKQNRNRRTLINPNRAAASISPEAARNALPSPAVCCY